MKTKFIAIGLIALMLLSLPSIALAQAQSAITEEPKTLNAKKYVNSLQEKLLKTIDKTTERLEKAAKMLEPGIVVSSDFEEKELLVKIESSIKELALLRAKVVSATSMEELKSLASEVMKEVLEAKELLKKFYSLNLFTKLKEAIGKAGETSQKMQEKINELQKMRIGTAELEGLKELFEKKVSEAKAYLEKAQALHDQNGDAGEIMELLKLAKEEMKDAFEAKESFKNLYERLLPKPTVTSVKTSVAVQ